ncbi:cerebellin-3-like [Dreissena polymorpha]|uniref:cerebellin-3-like n=1 Tax=Dreissena polymorpha TaxID=45954 RepID=UPI0022654BB6|nr:cerebellin-3-like [Dreissena polymorpha]
MPLVATEDSCIREIEQLIEIMASQSKLIEDIQKQTTDEFRRQQVIIDDHAKRVDIIHSELNSQGWNISTKPKRQESPQPVVAFTTVKTNNQDNVGVNQNILFDTIVLNEGGGFHSQHGLFIAPARGIYIFTATVLHMPQASISLHAAITHNGQDVALLHSSANVFDQGTQTVILKIEPGDEVWVRNVHYGGELITGAKFSSFSGILINHL